MRELVYLFFSCNCLKDNVKNEANIHKHKIVAVKYLRKELFLMGRREILETWHYTYTASKFFWIVARGGVEPPTFGL